MRKITVLVAAALMSMSVLANVDTDNGVKDYDNTDAYASSRESEFVSDEKTEEGFLTHYLNKAIESGMTTAGKNEGMEYGRKITDYVSAPKFGGYFIGKYTYSSQDGQHSGDGFSQRLVRLYVDGTILRDFAYRIQVQTNNDKFHVKDYYLEWKKFPEFSVKFGQYKRAFGLENPYNPWDVGVGDYSQLSKKLTGHGDFNGEANAGGRDQGLQFQGDLFPIGKDHHRLLHYQLMVANGQGINAADANSQKDFLGTIQFQPVSGVFFGAYGWTGNFTSGDVTVSRNRYLFFAKVEKSDWSFRAEYAHSTGATVSGYLDAEKKRADETHEADAWYATLGIPCTPWLKTWLKYDVYRDQATWGTTKTIYTICPVINLHKNLMFQPQFNYVHDRTLEKQNYCELWLETYVRF